jgi:hypothetical protein
MCPFIRMISCYILEMELRNWWREGREAGAGSGGGVEMYDGQSGNVQVQRLHALDERLCLAIRNLRKMDHDCVVLCSLLFCCSVVLLLMVDGEKLPLSQQSIALIYSLNLNIFNVEEGAVKVKDTFKYVRDFKANSEQSRLKYSSQRSIRI